MKNNKINTNLYKPLRSYDNLEENRSIIYKDNKDKCGVYLWFNKLNTKTYVGSSEDLIGRFRSYFSVSSLEKYSNMVICKAILKYGLSNFRLEILEYCEPFVVLEREKYYFELLLPDYNILKEPGNSSGFKHREESIAKMRES